MARNGACESLAELFAPAGADFVRRLELMQEPQHLEAGEYLLPADDLSGGIYFILSGSVELHLLSGEKSMRIDTVWPGSVVGLMGLLSRAHHDVQACTGSACELIFVPGEEFRALLRRYPEANMVVLKLLSAETIRATEALRRLRS